MAFAATLETFRNVGAPRLHDAVEEGIRRAVVWQKDSPEEVQHRFLADDPPMISRFYLWNITNVEEVRQGSKPKLLETGPYTFYMHREKVNVDFAFNREVVSFNEYLYFVPAPELSNGSLTEDRVTTLNLPLVGAIETIIAKSPHRFSSWLQFLARIVESWTDNHVHGIFTTRSPMELLFGYEDPLLKTIDRFIPGIRIDPKVSLVINMSSPEESERMGFRHAVATGAKNISQALQFRSWRGLSEIDSWRPPHKEKVRGTDATQFRPGLQAGDSVDVWIGEMFRAGILTEGVKVPPDFSNDTAHLFGNGRTNTYIGKDCKHIRKGNGVLNRKFPQEATSGTRVDEDSSICDHEKLPKIRNVHVGSVPVLRFRPDPIQRAPDPRFYQELDGLMNVTSPMFDGGPGPKIFISLPGYCAVDEVVPNSVDGVECDWFRHDLFIDVEPTTGITLRAQKALMFSSWFGKSYASVDKQLQDTFLPIFWAQQVNEASPRQLANFNKLLFAKRLLSGLYGPAAPSFAGAGVVLGVILFAFGLSSNGHDHIGQNLSLESGLLEPLAEETLTGQEQPSTSTEDANATVSAMASQEGP